MKKSVLSFEFPAVFGLVTWGHHLDIIRKTNSLELGNGFSFVGRQKEIVVDGVSRRNDMLFYHLRLHCYVELRSKAEERKA